MGVSLSEGQSVRQQAFSCQCKVSATAGPVLFKLHKGTQYIAKMCILYFGYWSLSFHWVIALWWNLYRYQYLAKMCILSLVIGHWVFTEWLPLWWKLYRYQCIAKMCILYSVIGHWLFTEWLPFDDIVQVSVYSRDLHIIFWLLVIKFFTKLFPFDGSCTGINM